MSRPNLGVGTPSLFCSNGLATILILVRPKLVIVFFIRYSILYNLLSFNLNVSSQPGPHGRGKNHIKSVVSSELIMDSVVSEFYYQTHEIFWSYNPSGFIIVLSTSIVVSFILLVVVFLILLYFGILRFKSYGLKFYSKKS